MNIIILGEDDKFIKELWELIGSRISHRSVQVLFSNDEFYEGIKLGDVDVCFMVVSKMNFKTCLQIADELIEKNPRVKLVFLYDYVLSGWLDKVNERQIRLVDKNSANLILAIRTVFSKKATYVAEKYLTSREEDVLQLVSHGHSQDEIANKLEISERTVNRHRASIYEKLGVTNQATAVRRGIELGLISINFEISEEF